jgi:hypothetical protein
MYTYEAVIPGGHSSTYSYSWTKPSNWSVMAQYDNFTRLYVPQYNPQYGTVRVSITNACGTSGYSGITVYPGYNCGYYFVYYPNPTNSDLKVEAIDATTENTLENSDLDFSVSLFDENQILMRNGKNDNNKIVIDVSNLPKGIYFLHISTKDQVIKEQIIIE